jgi:AhpD family alkylhydroperoxidase
MPDYFYPTDVTKYRGKLAELKGDILDAFAQFNNKTFAAGALSVREKELIAVATAHITRCPYCITNHTRKAKAAGATEEQIAEAIFVAVAMSAGASLAHSSLAMQCLTD